jgi:hypothetical protein
MLNNGAATTSYMAEQLSSIPPATVSLLESLLSPIISSLLFSNLGPARTHSIHSMKTCTYKLYHCPRIHIRENFNSYEKKKHVNGEDGEDLILCVTKNICGGRK